MVVYALIIINKAGGLIYQRDFAEGLNKLNINDYLVLAGTFHGVHAITTRLYPLSHSSPTTTTSTTSSNIPTTRPDPPSGIEVLETENFRLQCFSTLTGTKFLLFTEPQQPNVDKIVGKIYELYADYVMKNPFYQLEMPVRCEAWERKLVGYVRPLNSR
ncbi:Sybindin-like protein [Leptodontidium sp. MPI-SDFR-AT-0119]|nr:Sybindin-like protein [Leptodontidium sp. MPI-SDFR-AT-0119]